MEDGKSLNKFLESLNITHNLLTHITARLKVGGKLAKTLLDIGIVGTNLMSLNWAQSNGIKTKRWTTQSKSEWTQIILK